MLRANRTRAKQACWLYAFSFLVTIGLCLLDAVGLCILSQHSASVNNTLIDYRTILLLVKLALNFGAFILLVRWLWRGYANLHQVSGIHPGYPSSWALWAWFLPISALIRPYSIVREVWQYTQRAAWGQARKRPTLVGWWWAAYLMSSLCSWVFLTGATSPINQVLTSEIIRMAADAVVIALIWKIIRRISAFEDALAARAIANGAPGRLPAQ